MADKISTEYIGGEEIPIPIGEVLGASKRRIIECFPHPEGPAKVSIKIHRVAPQMSTSRSEVKGIFTRQVDAANGRCSIEIFYHSSLNFCWSRFIVVKEIAHGIGDCSDDCFIGQIGEFANAITAPDFWNTPDDANDSLHSEVFATVLAIELLLPRKHWSKILAVIANGGNNYRSIALEFKVPEAIVRIKLDSKYRKIVEDIYTKIEQKKPAIPPPAAPQ